MERFKRVGLNIICSLQLLIACIFGGGAVLLFNSMRWMFKTWKYLNMDELMYQLRAPVEGTNSEMISDYIQYSIPGVIIVIIALLMVGLCQYRKEWYQLILFCEVIVSICIIGGTAYYTWCRLDVKNYKENKGEYSSFIDQNYVDPKETKMEFPAQKRNLIYIFLESMEITYSDIADGGGMQVNYIPELTNLALENGCFEGDSGKLNGAVAMPNSTWTIAGMFAETAGLPLDLPIEGNSMDKQDTFFPQVETIGDILEKEGYNQTLLIGSDATFGGRRLMFSTHGNYSIKDYNYAMENDWIPKGYHVWWGYEDQKLFENAKKELTALSEEDAPFNLTMLTVDTHFEDGYVCELCEDEFENNQYGNVMACSSRQVAEFIQWIQQQDFYDNTTIVLCGDHPTMDSDFCDEVDREYERKVYTTYINSAVGLDNPDWKRDFTTYDQFPTTLASLGVKIDGNKLGLGTNLFSGEFTLTEKYSNSRVKSELKKKSKLMENLASDIVVPEEKEEEPVEEVPKEPTATVTVQDFNPDNGEIPIVVSDFQNIDFQINGMNAAIWSAEDQGDLFWTELARQEDGTYLVVLHTFTYYYQPGEYKIDVYVIDDNGNQRFLANQTFTIK